VGAQLWTNGKFLALALMLCRAGLRLVISISRIFCRSFWNGSMGCLTAACSAALLQRRAAAHGRARLSAGRRNADAIVRRTGERGWRAGGAAGWAHSACVVCFLLCPLAPNAFLFFIGRVMAAFFTDLTVPSAWATAQDIGWKIRGHPYGAFMNMGAGLAGGTRRLGHWFNT